MYLLFIFFDSETYSLNCMFTSYRSSQNFKLCPLIKYIFFEILGLDIDGFGFSDIPSFIELRVSHCLMERYL